MLLRSFSQAIDTLLPLRGASWRAIAIERMEAAGLRPRSDVNVLGCMVDVCDADHKVGFEFFDPMAVDSCRGPLCDLPAHSSGGKLQPVMRELWEADHTVVFYIYTEARLGTVRSVEILRDLEALDRLFLIHADRVETYLRGMAQRVQLLQVAAAARFIDTHLQVARNGRR